MPTKRVSDDVNHVRPDPTKKSRKLPPAPKPMPPFTPLQIPPTHGTGALPAGVDPTSPFNIFNLFFDEPTLAILALHTNENARMNPVPPLKASRKWRPTNAAELRAYLGAYIWMGLHPEHSLKAYWNTDHSKGPVHIGLTAKISRNRWQHIETYFHVSIPIHPPMIIDANKQSPFEKLEPLSEHLRVSFKKHWNTGTHLAVDETIQRLIGRSKETVNIPSKPEPEGFKIWVLANQGYVLDWIYHAKGDEGPIDLDNYWWGKEHLGFSKTQAVVLDLVTHNGISREMKHTVWLDNLFTSARLLRQLMIEGFGAAGTVRTSKTSREEQEECSGAVRKEVNRGLQRCLAELKLEHNSQLEWGKLYGELSDDGHVLEFAWKDQNVVLFMTTVHTGLETVKRFRRRPPKSATNARTSRQPFGESTVKKLLIPQFIDHYNHFMNGVDVADQLRSYYTTQRTHVKNWKPLWHFLLDTAITNAYQIAHYRLGKPFGESNRKFTYRAFRMQLMEGLFAYSIRLKSSLNAAKLLPLVELARPDRASDHTRSKMERIGYCVACQRAGRKAKERPTRIVLGELSANSIIGGTTRQRGPRVQEGCALCNIHLCDHFLCWNEHIEAGFRPKSAR